MAAPGHGVTRRLTASPARPSRSGRWGAAAASAQGLVDRRLAPGVQAVAMRGGETLWSHGFGFANLETSSPMSPASAVRVGSITKQFTAAALLQLQEAGRLSVEDRLARWVPDFPRAADISLARMLTHTSGLGEYLDTDGKVEVMLQRARLDYDRSAMLAMMAATHPVIGEPGGQWEYSNTAYALLGMIIEAVTGLPLAEVLRARLLAPNGLTRTAIDADAEVVPGRASGYSPDPKAAGGFANASYIAMSYAGAAGALRSTCEDLCRWHQALFSGRVLKPESLKLMTTPATLSGGRPTTTQPAPGAPRAPVSYGMGLFVGRGPHGLELSHDGGIQGFLSHLVSYPDSGMHIAHAVNADGLFLGGEALGGAVADLRREIAAAAFA